MGLALVSAVPDAVALRTAVTAAGSDHLVDMLVPDGMGGGFHVDFLLLTTRGILVIDLRDVQGNIFGGDQMAEWTVMDGPRRFTFTESAERVLRPHCRGARSCGRRAGGRAHRVHAPWQVSQGTAEVHAHGGLPECGVPGWEHDAIRDDRDLQ